MRIPIIATALMLAFSGAALAQDANSHAAHHPDQAAAQGPVIGPSPAVKPTGQTPVGTNCPMMGDGQANMMNGSMMASQSANGTAPPEKNGAAQKSMSCPMMQQHPAHTMILHQNNAQ